MQDLLSKRSNTPGISTKTLQYLNRLGFATINDFADYVNKTGEIPKIRGYGFKTLQDILLHLHQHNLKNGISKKYRIADSWLEKPLNKTTVRKRAVHQEEGHKNPEPIVQHDDSTEEAIDDESSMPCFRIQKAIEAILEERELRIFNSLSKFTNAQQKKTNRQIGEELGVSGERIRQLRIKTDKKVKHIIRKQIQRDPFLFKKSFYNDLYWSTHFIINDEIINRINLFEGINYSFDFYEYLFSKVFDKHNSYKINNKSSIFINKRHLVDQDLKKTISSVLRGKYSTNSLPLITDKLTEIIIKLILDEMSLAAKAC